VMFRSFTIIKNFSQIKSTHLKSINNLVNSAQTKTISIIEKRALSATTQNVLISAKKI